jgi:hypothetical protein
MNKSKNAQSQSHHEAPTEDENDSSKLEEIKLINENEIKYDLFILNSDQDIDKFYGELVDHLKKLTAAYIWNNEKFVLDKAPQRLNEPYFVCSGSLDFGDNLEDEWFLVYCLTKLTQRFAKRLCAQVRDYDGEFLLIHTANYLPEWASSGADGRMTNRVFIHAGQLHIIPPATTPAQVSYMPAAGPLDTALHGAKIVFDFGARLTLASSEIQQCLRRRLNLFDETTTMMHRATCILPAKLVWLIKTNPSLISLAINIFCERDPVDLRLCSQLRTFRPHDLVNYRVCFTKHLYGKLKYSEYRPEKRHEWPSLNSLMSTTLGTTTSNETLVRERSSLGFKLTCAFEIISQQHAKVEKFQDKPLESYIDRLKSIGYFKDYLEDSQPFFDLMEKAKENFNSQPRAASAATNKLLDSFNDDLAARDDYVIKLKEEILSEQERERDDSDEWLCVEAPALDDYLDMYSRGEVSSAYDFRLISNAFKKFLRIPPQNKGENLLDGVKYEQIEAAAAAGKDQKLVDFNLEDIEKSLKGFLKIETDTEDNNNEEEEEEEENDSFYEIDDDLLENNDESVKSIDNLMEQMDDELRGQKDLSRCSANTDDLDLDFNLVTNALESYSSQLGITGPVSNILKSMGI